MDRKLIDAYRFEEELYHEAFERDSDMQRWDSGCWIRYKLFERMLEKQPAVDVEPHWIPCSERLPEVREWVLCQCRAGIMDVLRLTADGSWDKGYPHTEYMGGFVVAWMPLPKPYEGDKE